jgi:drug/metabolite transporter (DMT)-like permease
VIAAYTLVDAAGARASGHAVAYTLWLFVLMAVPTVPVLLRFRIAVPGGAEVARALGGGGASLAAYALALWAMAQAPVAAVAALRETATLFGLVLARLLLGERPGAAGWAGAGAIAAGAALIRLA